MSIEKIIGLIFLGLALISLITLLFITTIPLAQTEKKEREKRSKMYSTITRYLNNLMIEDENNRQD